MKKTLLLALLLIGCVSTTLQAQTVNETEQKIKDDLYERFPNAEEFTLQNQLLRYVVKFKNDSANYNVTYSSNGNWKQTIYSITANEVPEEVMEGFGFSKYTDWDIEAYEIVEKGNKTRYRLTVEKAGWQKKFLYFNEKGRLVKDKLTI